MASPYYWVIISVLSPLGSGAPPTLQLRNGVSMPMIAAGSGGWNSSNAYASFTAALRVGFTHLDTALFYGNQEGVAKAIAGVPRDSFFLETKVPGCMVHPTTWDPLTCYKDAVKNLKTDLEQLNATYVDLMIIHYPPLPSFIFRSCGIRTGSCEMIRAQWKAMEEFYLDGKARAIGVSNFCPSCLDCLSNTTIFPMVNQVAYHLGMGVDPHGMMTYAKDRGFHMQAYGALGNPPLDPRDPGASPEIMHGNLTTRIARAHNKSTAQVALKWIVEQGVPAVTKSLSPDHLSQDLDLWSWHLDSDELRDLNAARKPEGHLSFACSSDDATLFV